MNSQSPQSRHKDFTKTGLKIEGQYENDRNQDYSELYKDVIREAFGVRDVIIGHHLVYQTEYEDNGFMIQLVEEIPSVDALIFDHDIARKIFGDKMNKVLMDLACTPCDERDEKYKEYYYGR